MNNSIILQKMAKKAAEDTGRLANVLDHLKRNRYTYGGAGIGALLGGATGAAVTQDRRNRLKNTLFGALGGGVAGAGVGYMGQQNHNLRGLVASNESKYKTNLAAQRAQSAKELEGLKSTLDENEARYNTSIEAQRAQSAKELAELKRTLDENEARYNTSIAAQRAQSAKELAEAKQTADSIIAEEKGRASGLEARLRDQRRTVERSIRKNTSTNDLPSIEDLKNSDEPLTRYSGALTPAQRSEILRARNARKNIEAGGTTLPKSNVNSLTPEEFEIRRQQHRSHNRSGRKLDNEAWAFNKETGMFERIGGNHEEVKILK